MKPTHPVELLACAIATREGFFVAGKIPVLRNNPGDLDYAGQIGALRVAPTEPDPAIAAFWTLDLGVAALFRQLWLQVATGQTVRQVIHQWCATDPTYLPEVLAWTGLPADTPILELLPALTPLNVAAPSPAVTLARKRRRRHKRRNGV